MSSYLIYHPKRCISILDHTQIYHDSTRGNQDPYVWNKSFLHTYCHITQIKPTVNSINFWVSGDTFPNFSHLYCDLIFTIDQIIHWEQKNSIDRNGPIVKSDEAFIDHYQWATYQHHYKRRRRFTLKANPDRSFQPQDITKGLIDIVPFLTEVGLSLGTLRQVLQANKGSKPFCIDSIALALYEWLDQQASIKLKGELLEEIRRNNPQLGSKQPKS